MYWLAVVAAPSRAKTLAVLDTAVASVALAATALDGIWMARSCPANVLSVEATRRSRLVTQSSLPWQPCTLAE